MLNNLTTYHRRGFAVRMLAVASVAAAGFGAAAPAAAQNFPTKAITIVVPFSAGGTTDILARIVAQPLGAELGQSVVIDNRAGAGGNIGAAIAAKAPADGHTLFMGTVGTHAINASLYKKLPYDPIKDFAPLSRVASVPNLLVAHPSRPYKTIKELIEYGKAHPGKVNYASAGSGSSIHLSGELFESMAKVGMVHIPYRGSAPAVNDLLAGQVDIMFDNMPSAIQHVRAGKLRAIAVTTSKRSDQLPQVPTIAESGVPGYEATSWFGLFTNAGTPAPVVAKLNAALAKVLAQPDVKKRIAEQGGMIQTETPEQFAAFIQAESQKWGKVVRDSGATAD